MTFFSRSHLYLSLFVLCLAAQSSGSFAFADSALADSSDASPTEASVTFKDVKGWKDLGLHWIGGLDSKGSLIAIYDLSYPRYRERVLLGSLNTGPQNYDSTIHMLETAKQEKTNHSAAAVLSSENTSASNKDATNLKNLDTAIQTLKDYKAKAQSLHITAENQWWTQVAWKSAETKQSPVAPHSFSLGDIALPSHRSEHPQINDYAESHSAMALKQLQFVQNPNGDYDFYWNPSPTLESTIDLPVKIADVSCPKCVLDERLTSLAIEEALSLLLGEIPVPYLGGLISAAVSELEQFRTELLNDRQEMLLEFVRSTQENSPWAKSPTTEPVFSPSEIDAIIESTSYSSAGIIGSIGWIFHTPIEQWNSQESDAISQATNSLNYLTGHSEKVELLNPRFGVEEDQNSVSKIYSLSANRYWNILPPFLAFDSQLPNKIRYQRIAIESAHALVHFLQGFIPIPFIGSIVSGAYDWIIESPMNSLQHWEARLSTHLRLRNSTENKWNTVLDTLELQAINPFEISRQMQDDLARSRRESLITHHEESPHLN